MRDSFQSSQVVNMESMFTELTNQEDEGRNASPALTGGDSASQQESNQQEQRENGSSYPIGPLEDSDEDPLGDVTWPGPNWSLGPG